MTFGPGQVRYIQDDRKNKDLDEEPEEDEPECDWRGIGRSILDDDRYEIAIVLLTFIALFMEDTEILLLTQTFQHTDQHGQFLLTKEIDCAVVAVDVIVAKMIVHRLIAHPPCFPCKHTFIRFIK